MEAILDDVRRDAITKLKASTEKEKKPLEDAAVLMMGLAMVARREGLLSLELAVEEEQIDMDWCLGKVPQALLAMPVKSSYLKRIILLVTDGTDPEKVVEIGVSAYWKHNPQGIMAMVYYIYLCGTLYIQCGMHPNAMHRILKSLLPEECHPIFEESSAILDEIVDRESKERYKAWEEKEKLLRKEIAEQFPLFHPVIKSPELREVISTLEEEILVNLSGVSVKKVLKAYDYNLEDCLYGLCDEARQKILDAYSQLWHDSDETARKVIEAGERPEDEVLGSVLIMSGVIKRLRCAGEI